LIRRVRARPGGFTLIEVIGAVLIFSIGVIMVLNITSALSRRTEWSALASTLNVMGQQRLDSVFVLTYSTVAAGTTTDTVTVRGVSFRRQLAVTQSTPLVKKVELTLSAVSGSYPSFDGITYLRDTW
jgi:Tfp pilus assembly protein PilV